MATGVTGLSAGYAAQYAFGGGRKPSIAVTDAETMVTLLGGRRGGSEPGGKGCVRVVVALIPSGGAIAFIVPLPASKELIGRGLRLTVEVK